MNDKVLFVDDDKNLLMGIERSFHGHFQLDTALGGEAGLERIEKNGPYAVVVSDRQMPGMDGIKFLSIARQRAPETVRVMLTGNIDLENAVRVVNEGNIFRFLLKPASREILSTAINDAIAQYRLVIAEKELLTKTLNGSIKLLTDILSQVEPKSFGHTEKLRSLITTVSQKVPLEKTWEIHFAAMLSTVGYVTLPPETILKSRLGKQLTRTEEQLLQAVPETTAKLLSSIPRLEEVAKIIRYCGKNFDGSGTPLDNINGEAIPVGSRLLKILESMLHLQSKGLTQAAALSELPRHQGCYDPKLLAAVSEAFGVADNVAMGDTKILGVSIQQLKVGMILCSDVITRDGTLVLSSGHELNDLMIKRLANFDNLSGLKQPIFVEVIENKIAA